jgi:hypothetical protein
MNGEGARSVVRHGLSCVSVAQILLRPEGPVLSYKKAFGLDLFNWRVHALSCATSDDATHLIAGRVFRLPHDGAYRSEISGHPLSFFTLPHEGLYDAVG